MKADTNWIAKSISKIGRLKIHRQNIATVFPKLSWADAFRSASQNCFKMSSWNYKALFGVGVFSYNTVLEWFWVEGDYLTFVFPSCASNLRE